MPRGSLLNTSDCSIRVQGELLPVHTQVLALKSRVLRDLVAEFAYAPQYAVIKQEKLVLDAFSDAPLLEALCLLRFLYWDDDMNAITLNMLENACKDHLRGILELAHKLDVPRVTFGIDAFVTSRLDGIVEMVYWENAAASLQMDEMWSACIHKIAASLVNSRSVLGQPETAFVEVSQLQNCSKEGILAVLSSVVTAVRNDLFVPSTYEISAWRGLKLPLATHTWTIPNFRHAFLGNGATLSSAHFTYNDLEWCLLLRTADANVKISMSLVTDQAPGTAVRATYTMQIMNMNHVAQSFYTVQTTTFPPPFQPAQQHEEDEEDVLIVGIDNAKDCASPSSDLVIQVRFAAITNTFPSILD